MIERMRRILGNIALALIVFIIMLFLAEGAWRLLISRGDLARHFDPEIGRVNPPNTTWTIRTPEYVTTMRTNSRGFRGAEFSNAPKNDGMRILFLGDSFVEAKQIPLETRFAERTAALLAKKLQKPVFLQTLAIGGAEPAREFLFYDRIGVSFHPDIVVQVFFLENDLLPTAGAYLFSDTEPLRVEDIWLNPPAPCFLKCQLLKRSEFALRLYQVLRSMRVESPRSTRALLGEGEFYWYTKEGQEAAIQERRFDVLAAFADAVRSRVESQEGKYIAVLIPGAFEIHPSWRKEIIVSFEDIVPREVWNPSGLLDLGIIALKKRGINVLDIRPEFHAAAEKGFLYYKLDPHLNPEGHKIVAERIYQEVFGNLP